jgi:NAD/NADP transhydrogenase beta subunit
MDTIRMSSIYLANVVGSITATGSVVAFGKLQVGPPHSVAGSPYTQIHTHIYI